MIRATRTTALIAALVLASAAPAASDSEPEPVGPKLPDKVRALLVEEMIAVLGATQDITDALIRGEDDVVADRAQAIHDSFILQQEMTASDRQALLEAVPDAFVKRDRAFHTLTGNLAEAARAGNRVRQQELFGQIVGACVDCHARYATNRFPGFAD
jgi:cytochrome c553